MTKTHSARPVRTSNPRTWRPGCTCGWTVVSNGTRSVAQRRSEQHVEVEVEARFEQLGREAFASGMACTPTADPAVSDAIAGLPVGGGAVKIMRAWMRGWTAANLAAPIEL